MPDHLEKIEVRRHRIAYVETFEVYGDELNRLQYEEPQRSHELSIALFSFGASLALLTPLIVGEPPKLSDRRFAVLVAIIIVGFGFFVFFFARWLLSFRNRTSLFEQIRARQTGPIGEEGAEISAEQLAELPSEAASGPDDVSGAESKE